MASKHSKVAINHAKEDTRTVVVIITMAGIRTVVDTIIAVVITTVADTTRVVTVNTVLIMIQMQSIHSRSALNTRRKTSIQMSQSA